ncbi:hypothetical protein ACRAWD_29290 [Caulobacter segnis]
MVTTHRGPLEQALIRLVDNAVRYGGAGQGPADEAETDPTAR